MISLLTGGNGLLVSLVGVLLGAVALFFKGRADGKRSERNRQQQAEYEAMSEAHRIEQEVAGNSPKSNRDAFKRWGGPS
jgi:hypothetical protein